MRLAKFEGQLADLKGRATSRNWQDALNAINKVENAIEINHLSGRLRDFKVAREAIAQSLASAIDAHEAAIIASDELASRQSASAEMHHLLVEIDDSITTTSAFVETEAYEDEQAEFRSDVEQLLSTRQEMLEALIKVEADWQKLSENGSQAHKQADLFLEYVDKILDEMEHILSEIV